MKTRLSRLCIAILILGVGAVSTAVAAGNEWQVVVNNGDTVPGTNRNFNSYNPPSLSVARLVVFRARSKGGMMGNAAHGIFTRDMFAGTPVTKIFDRDTVVPAPNNLNTTFVEPPSFPRIGMWGDTVASRGNHSPVWSYSLPSDSESRGGTTGIYTNPYGPLIAGASNLGDVPAFPFFAVPGSGGIKFDVFPGAPSLIDNTIVFKGNYTLDEVSRTGVYYRDLRNATGGGGGEAVLIANNVETIIPGHSVVFGSTAPPSAAIGPAPTYEMRLAVFAGFDSEQKPTAGGIYLAELNGPSPPLLPLVEVGSHVPGEEMGTVFRRLGESVSFDGRFVGFWGTWGTEEKELILQCPEEGNRERVAYCKFLYGNGYATTVPVFQGIFVHDIQTGRTTAVAKTPDDYDDFVYWNFSGRVPGTGDESGEPARWRSATFVAVSGLVNGTLADATFHTAFKARTGFVDPDTGAYEQPIDGIYLRGKPGNRPIETLVETGMDGTLIDPEAIDPESEDPAAAWLPVTKMEIERDGFRGDSIAVTVSMASEDAGWAGVYLMKVRDERH